jgi:4-hydroxy-2-oxoheptanedioate aldolase
MPRRRDAALHPLEAACRLRERWRRGETTIGGRIYFRDSFGVEVVARSEVDWVCVDTQHGLARAGDVASLMQAVGVAGKTSLVRVPWNEPGVIMNALDAGAAGVLVPMVGSAADAGRAVRACRYPPAGIRSWGPTRPALGEPAHTTEWANERVLCIVMVETREGVENLDAILGVDGVDAVFIGPSDLALSFELQRADPENHARVSRLKEACAARGMPVGAAAISIEEARGYASSGLSFVALPSDAVLLGRAYADFLQGSRSPAEPITHARQS